MALTERISGLGYACHLIPAMQNGIIWIFKFIILIIGVELKKIHGSLNRQTAGKAIHLCEWPEIKKM